MIVFIFDGLDLGFLGGLWILLNNILINFCLSDHVKYFEKILKQFSKKQPIHILKSESLIGSMA